MSNDIKKLIFHETKMALEDYIPLADIREELRLLADSMSSHAALARKIGISDAYLCDVLQGRREPGPAICRFLKVKRVVVYQEIENDK
jgi:hypothetical protein